jgi:hypothetical protein
LDQLFRTRGSIRGYIPATQQRFILLTQQSSCAQEAQSTVQPVVSTNSVTNEAPSLIISATAITPINDTNNPLPSVTLQVGPKIINFPSLKAQAVANIDSLASVKASRWKPRAVPVNIQNQEVNNNALEQFNIQNNTLQHNSFDPNVRKLNRLVSQLEHSNLLVHYEKNQHYFELLKESAFVHKSGFVCYIDLDSNFLPRLHTSVNTIEKKINKAATPQINKMDNFLEKTLFKDQVKAQAKHKLKLELAKEASQLKEAKQRQIASYITNCGYLFISTWAFT